MTPKKMTVIAVDGPSGVGKTTLAAALADHYGFDHLASGGLYRGVAREMLLRGLDLADVEAAVQITERLPATANERDLRREEVSAASSVISAYPEVRRALLAAQRRFAAAPPGGRGAVIDGRDIGTVVCPDCRHKIFLTAALEARAGRRAEQLRLDGHKADYREILQGLKARDSRDGSRPVAPLKAAKDAMILDSSKLTAAEVLAAAIAFVER